MVIQCPECGKKYKIDPEKIPEKGAKIACPGCGHNFIVRKKAEKETAAPAAAPVKMPPCQICGNPSTRVLQGNPPLNICENCFEREKEKNRRFTQPPPGLEESVPKPAPEPPAAKPVPANLMDETRRAIPEPMPETPEPSTPRLEAPDIPEMEMAPNYEFISTAEAPAGEKAEPAETEYFDSFAEIPDLEGASAKPEEKPEPEAKPAAPREKAGPAPVAPPPSPPAPARKKGTPLEDFIFSPKEIERRDDTAASQPAPAAYSDGGSAPSRSEAEVDREIFGELPEAGKAETGGKLPALPKKSLFARLPRISLRTGLIMAAVVAVLGLGYFILTRPSLRSPSSKTSPPGLGKETPVAKALSEEDQKIIDQHLALAQDLYRMDTDKNYVGARSEILAALRLDKKNPAAAALRILVTATMAERDPGFISISRAKVQLKKAGPEVQAMPEYGSSRALVYLADQDYSGARVVGEELVKNHPDFALGYWILSLVNMSGAVKKYDESEPLLLKALELDPKLAQARFGLAELEFQKKQYPAALEQYQEVLKLSPSHLEAAARIKELQPLLAPKEKPEEKPAGGLLLVQPVNPQPGATVKEPDLIPVKPEPGNPQAASTVQAPQVDVNLEIQKYFLQIISQTRQPLSRSPVSAPAPTPVPNPTPKSAGSPQPQPTSTRPPEEAP